MGPNGVTSISIMVVIATLEIAGIETILELFGAFLLSQLVLSSVTALLTKRIMPRPQNTILIPLQKTQMNRLPIYI